MTQSSKYVFKALKYKDKFDRPQIEQTEIGFAKAKNLLFEYLFKTDENWQKLYIVRNGEIIYEAKKSSGGWNFEYYEEGGDDED